MRAMTILGSTFDWVSFLRSLVNGRVWAVSWLFEQFADRQIVLNWDSWDEDRLGLEVETNPSCWKQSLRTVFRVDHAGGGSPSSLLRYALRISATRGPKSAHFRLH